VRHFEDSENCAQCGGTILATTDAYRQRRVAVPGSFQRDTGTLRRCSDHAKLHDRHGNSRIRTAAEVRRVLQDDWRLTPPG